MSGPAQGGYGATPPGPSWGSGPQGPSPVGGPQGSGPYQGGGRVPGAGRAAAGWPAGGPVGTAGRGGGPAASSRATGWDLVRLLGVAVVGLGILNFVWGFLPELTFPGAAQNTDLSVFAIGPGYVPILLLIAGLLALAAFLPAPERSRFAVAAVSTGGAIGAIVSLGTAGPWAQLAGTDQVSKGAGAILLVIFGIIQAVVAAAAYVVGSGIGSGGVSPHRDPAGVAPHRQRPIGPWGGPDSGGPNTGGPNTGGPNTGGPNTGGPNSAAPAGVGASDSAPGRSMAGGWPLAGSFGGNAPWLGSTEPWSADTDPRGFAAIDPQSGADTDPRGLPVIDPTHAAGRAGTPTSDVPLVGSPPATQPPATQPPATQPPAAEPIPAPDPGSDGDRRGG